MCVENKGITRWGGFWSVLQRYADEELNLPPQDGAVFLCVGWCHQVTKKGLNGMLMSRSRERSAAVQTHRTPSFSFPCCSVSWRLEFLDWVFRQHSLGSATASNSSYVRAHYPRHNPWTPLALWSNQSSEPVNVWDNHKSSGGLGPEFSEVSCLYVAALNLDCCNVPINRRPPICQSSLVPFFCWLKCNVIGVNITY